MLTKTLIRSREILGANDVVALLNFELSAYDECDGCHFTSVKPSIRDESGSNWRGAAWHSDGPATEAARRISRQVLDEVHEAYNIE
jgi:hypothetical protein